MDVLVVGGDGFIGRYLCTELDANGHDVTALSRSPEVEVLPDSVETVVGDVTDYESIVDSFEGIDGVINLVALSPLFEPSGGNESHEIVHLGGTRHCVRAAEEHDVERFVQMSALDADPEGPTNYLRAKGKAENVVRASDLDRVIIRPSVVFGDGGEFIPFTMKLTTPYVTALPGGGSTLFQPIYVEDLVPILADALVEDEHRDNTYELGGPAVLTLGEVAKLAYLARGISLKIIPVPMALAGVGLTLAGAIPGFPMGADQYRSLKLDNAVPDNDVTAFGVDATTLTTVGQYLDIDDELHA